MIKRYYLCRNCETDNSLRTSVNDRVELEREWGETFRHDCRHCHRPNTVHVNDVRARPRRAIFYTAAVVAVVFTAALWRVGFIAYISVALPFIVRAAQEKEAHNFNSYRVGRTR